MHSSKLALAVLLLAGVASAQDTNRWETSAAAGATLTRGNSDTFLGTLSLNSTRKWERDEAFLGASGTYGTTETDDVEETTTASANAFGQYNYLFTERFYGGVRLDILHDRIADVKYRATLSPLVGYYLIKDERTRLSVEAGPSLIAERVGDNDDVYAAMRLAERFEHKLSDTAKVWQSIEYLPQIDRWGNYIINAEVGAEAALTEKLSLRGVIQDTYDNEPAPGRKKNDLKLITSLVYKF